MRFFSLVVRRSLAQLVRSPSHSRRAEAARRSARHVVLLTAILGAAIIALMYLLDATEIGWMPKRGTPSLWPIRILTDFGKSAYVLWALAGLLFVVAIVSPRLRGNPRSLLLGLGTRLQFVFLAVLVPALVGDVLKWIIGRGRPFVGGEGNVFNFRHFGGTEAFRQLSVRPCQHRLRAGVRGFRAVAAGSPRDDRVRRRDRAEPPRAAGASSE